MDNNNCRFYLLPRRRSAGFTLIEMIITVAIAAILMSIAVPSFQQMMQQNRTAAVTNQLLGTFRMARSEAVTRGKTVTVCKSANVTATNPTCTTDGNWETGWLIFVDDNNNGSVDTGELIKVGQLEAGQATIAGNGVLINQISFASSGKTTSSTMASLIIQQSAESESCRKITVNRVGRIFSEEKHGAECVL
ncbi:GspH/FimT family pseudopilin [Thiospirillum jenense]|uniref:GspH/FimT family pseudopilin n=1 Tax=Thiospirillum jenense TaxID=1653858 RepID=UPI0030B84429